MTGFRFPLQRVLEWRQAQTGVEESALKRLLATLAAHHQAHAALEAASLKSELKVREWRPVSGADLAALSRFRLGVRARQTANDVSRADCERRIERQRALVLAARRNLRIIEQLREARFQEWRADQERELEALAADAYLARYSREIVSLESGQARPAQRL